MNFGQPYGKSSEVQVRQELAIGEIKGLLIKAELPCLGREN